MNDDFLEISDATGVAKTPLECAMEAAESHAMECRSQADALKLAIEAGDVAFRPDGIVYRDGVYEVCLTDQRSGKSIAAGAALEALRLPVRYI